MSAHTPLPWITQSAAAHPPTTHIVSDSGNHIASVPRLANAEMIVRAVNSHQALVDALTLSRRNVGSLLQMLPADADATERKSLEKWLGELNGALAKANVF